MTHVKLFCVPYAGGSATIFVKWKNYLREYIEIYPVELKGRGKRFVEPFSKTFEDVVEDSYREIIPHLHDGPYVLFGHSFGSCIIYEVAHKIQLEEQPLPFHIIFSGRGAPHVTRAGLDFHLLSDSDLKKEVVKLGGTPKELAENDELFDTFLPILRSDFTLHATYEHREKSRKLDCPITVFYGEEDAFVQTNALIGWREVTHQSCEMIGFPGGHFFINDQVERMMQIMNGILLGTSNVR